MTSNSKSVSKRQKTETNAVHENPISTDAIPDFDSLGSELAISGNAVIASNTVFTEDILPEILDNLEILSEKDLLTFRLVNRCWRDAATSVILKRSLWEINLDFGKVTLDEDGNEVGQVGGYKFNPDGTLAVQPTSYSAYKYFNVCKPKSFLSDLNQLISTSPKFPCESFYFDMECSKGFGNLCPLSDCAAGADQHQIDLFHFFFLYGKKIKNLAITSGISKKAVQNMLYVHMPQLQCLDIQSVDDFSSKNEANEVCETQKLCLPPMLTLNNIKEFVLGYASPKPPADKLNFVRELISVLPMLSIIQDVHTASLDVLLEMNKCHLVNELHLDDPLPTSVQFQKLLTDSILPLQDKLSSVLRLQLSKLIVWFDSDFEHSQDTRVKGLNLILSATKDSLEYFEFKMLPSDNIANLFIPPLPLLKCLKLEDHISSRSVTTRFHFLGDVIGDAVQAKNLNADQSADDFNTFVTQNQNKISNIPADYFPRLRQVKLYSEKTREYESDKLMEFFSVEYLQQSFCLFIPETIIPADTLLTVTTLKLGKFAWFDKDIAKCFPQVTNLKIHCTCDNTLRNWVWTAFPKLKRFEISRLPGSSGDTKFVDSFFTGISAKLCAQFKADATSAHLAGRRTKPYIGNCANLKELKIGFDTKLTSKFASKVTAIHGFQDVIHQTKIIFSFQNRFFRIFKVKDIKETRQFLEPVAAYIEIEM